MNVTSRIEDVAGPGEILIAESTRKALLGSYRVGEPREINAPGIDETLRAYPLNGEGP